MTAVDVIVPKMGLTIESVEVAVWLAAVGDTVRAGDPLVELNADKADVVVEAPASGVLVDILAAPGDDVPLGTVIARIGATVGDAVPAAEALPAAQPAHGAGSSGTTPVGVAAGAADPAAVHRRPVSSPYARHLADERGVDLRTVRGSGPEGRIVARDLRPQARSAPAAGPSSALESDRVQQHWARATLAVHPTDHVSSAALSLACAWAAATVGWLEARPVEFHRHQPTASTSLPLTDWHDLSAAGLDRRLDRLEPAADVAVTAGLAVHDVSRLGLDAWEFAGTPVRTVVIGTMRPRVVIEAREVPSLRTVLDVPIAVAGTDLQGAGAFFQALENEISRVT